MDLVSFLPHHTCQRFLLLILSGLLPVVAGCQTTERVWVKPDTSQQDFQVDATQCESLSVPGMPLLQSRLIYSNCMREKGWQIEDRPKGKGDWLVSG